MKLEYDPSKGKRGPVIPMPPEKVRITIRLDRDIVDHFRDLVRKVHRGNYQTLINDALREHLRKPGLAEQVGAEVPFGAARGVGENQSDRLMGLVFLDFGRTLLLENPDPEILEFWPSPSSKLTFRGAVNQLKNAFLGVGIQRLATRTNRITDLPSRYGQ
jgi:hypothetical protein